MMKPLSYPEQHDAWLNAMGITRWQQQDRTLTKIVLSDHHTDAQVELQKVIVDGQDAWPEKLLSARYWLIGSLPLEAETAYLLAGMMKAINASIDEVVYVCVESDTRDTVETGLPSWPTVHIQTLSNFTFPTHLTPPENVQVIWLGNELQKWDDSAGSNTPLIVPDLNETLIQPELKREAWKVLKQLLSFMN